jgi:hypothetical protein
MVFFKHRDACSTEVVFFVRDISRFGQPQTGDNLPWLDQESNETKPPVPRRQRHESLQFLSCQQAHARK